MARTWFAGNKDSTMFVRGVGLVFLIGGGACVSRRVEARLGSNVEDGKRKLATLAGDNGRITTGRRQGGRFSKERS